MGAAAERWAEELRGWAIPDEILAQAPESPWGFPPELFAAPADPMQTVSRRRALEALPDGGSVLDVGCGGGVAGLALVPPAALVIGADESGGMLASFDRAAAEHGVAHRRVEGRWPDIADATVAADVAVCHHVFYNVADLEPFVTALTAAASYRVVVEITATHPMTTSASLWRHFWDLDRPTGPTADLAADVLRELGVDVHIDRWSRPPRDVPREVYVRMHRRRLCLPADAEPDVDRVMGPTNWPRDVVTLSWDV